MRIVSVFPGKTELANSVTEDEKSFGSLQQNLRNTVSLLLENSMK